MTLEVDCQRPDWFLAERELVVPLSGVPGLVKAPPHGRTHDKWRLHRSHLPLLDEPEARRLLAGYYRNDWAARDASTADRGFKLRTVQHAAVDFITQRRGTLLGDDPRVGKGHVVGTQILTVEGWRAVESLRPGDQVIGSNGRPCRVMGVFFRGSLPLYRVAFSDGVSLRVDGEHRWGVWNHNAWHRNEPMKVRTTLELLPVVHEADGKCGWRVPLVAPIELPARELALDPYLLGVLLGDGSLSSGHVEFTPGDDDVPREIERVLPQGVRLVRKASKDRAQSWSIRGQRQHHNPVLFALRDLGLMGKLSHEKFIPDAYLHASKEQRLALLQGLMDTDGELHGERKRFVGFSFSSRVLAEAVRFLVESFGGVAHFGIKLAPRYRHKGETRVGRPSYRLTISMPDGISPFRARRGYRDRPKFKPARIIRSIEPDGEGEVVCISVDAPDQLYVTEHCIVTHNTLAAIMSHDPDAGALVVICPAMVRPVWIGWLNRVFPGEPILVMKGREPVYPVESPRLVVGHYDILSWWQSDRPIGTLIFDEAHFLTNRDSKRSKAAVFMASRAERVICATGTPIWNLPTDLWNVLGIVAPAAFGGYHEFAGRYGAPEPTAYGVRYMGVSNEQELQARLSEVMIRRRWIDVQDDLPAISRNVVLVDLAPAVQRKLDLLAAEIASNKASTIGLLSRYRERISTFKLATVVAEAERMLDRGEPVVVWTWHRELAESIAGSFGDRGFLLTGDTPMGRRENTLGAWNAHPAGVLVCTMAVAQVGLDFSHAHLAIFAEIDYTPAILAQAEMRTYTPTRPMNVTYVVANHMIEQRIVMALIRKLGAANPLGVGAANDAIAVLQSTIFGTPEEPDLDRLLEEMLAS